MSNFVQSISDSIAGSGIGSSLGDFATNLGGTVSDIFSGMGQASAGGGGGGGTDVGGNAANISNAVGNTESLIDPASAAQTAIQGPQPNPQPSSTQNPQGPQGGQQGGQGETFAPQSAIEALRKEIAKLRSQRAANPYQTGGAKGFDPQLVQSDEGPAPRDPTPRPPWFKWAGGKPFQPANPPDPNEVTDLPGTFKKGEGFVQDPDPRAGPAGEEAVGNALRAKEAGEAAVDRALPEPPAGGPPTNVSGGLSGLAKAAGVTIPDILAAPLGAVGTYFGSTTPAETGELPYGGYKGDTSSFAPEEEPGPEDPTIKAGGPGHGARPTQDPTDPPGTAKAPATGKKVQTVDPKTKKPVDPKTGDPLPTKKGHYEPATGNARDKQWFPDGRGPIMRDVGGGQGVPPMLGQLAQMALPLIMMGMMGGFGGGRRGPGMVGRRWGHPGGFGGRNFGFGPGQHWPYHHPQFGWRLHGRYPGGGGWLPMDPRHMRELMGGGDGGNALPFTGDGNDRQSGEPSYDPYYDKGSRYRNPGQPSATAIGRGPNGQKLPYSGEEAADFTHQVAENLGMDSGVAQQILAGESSYGQNYTNNRERDGIPSYGPFQLHDSGPGSVGYAFKQATGEDPADPSTWKDQIVFALKWAQKNGWTAWGAARDHGIPQWAGIDRRSNKQFAWNYGRENGGVTTTGGSADGSDQMKGKPPMEIGVAAQ